MHHILTVYALFRNQFSNHLKSFIKVNYYDVHGRYFFKVLKNYQISL